MNKLFQKIILMGFSTLITSMAHAMSIPVPVGTPVYDQSSVWFLTAQLEQLKTQLKNFETKNYQWSDAQALIQQLEDAVNQKNDLAKSAATNATQFEKFHPGYRAPENFAKEYQDNVNMTQATLRGVHKSLGKNAADFNSENKRLKFIQGQVEGSEGQLQAIKASAQIASETVSQLQLLRQTMLAQTNAQTAYYATQIQTESDARAELSAAISNGSKKVPKYGTSGSYLKVPNFKEYDRS